MHPVKFMHSRNAAVIDQAEPLQRVHVVPVQKHSIIQNGGRVCPKGVRKSYAVPMPLQRLNMLGLGVN